MTTYTRMHLPSYVLWTFAAAAVVGMPTAYSFGLLPQDWSVGRTILMSYFGTWIGMLAFAFVLSGNTIHHHYLTGTIQRRTSPTEFWCVTVAYIALAAILLASAGRG